MAQKPAFLDILDTDRSKAAECFYHFALRYFEVVQPKYLSFFEQDERLDVKHEICLHCIKDGFRVLRLYYRTSSEFSAWFHVIAHNKAMDILKSQNRRPKFAHICLESHDSREEFAHSGPGPDRDVENREQLRLVNKVIVGMNRYCQLLLRLAGDELTPMEITRILRWPTKKSKKVATDVSYCREVLRRKLSSEIGEPSFEAS